MRIKHKKRPILLKRLPDTPKMRANIPARVYQSLKPGVCKEAAGRAVVLTVVKFQKLIAMRFAKAQKQVKKYNLLPAADCCN